LKAQVSLEVLLIVAAVISIILLMLPVFFNLKTAADRSFEKLHLKNVANQLMYYCQKSFFIQTFNFELNVFELQNWDVYNNLLTITSKNAETNTTFQCFVSEQLESGKHQFQIADQQIQKIN